MFTTSTRPTRRTIAALALLLPLTLAAAACGEGNDEDLAVAATPTTASAPSSGAPLQEGSGTGDCDTKCTTSMIINITNNSSHTLDFAGNESNTPENVNNTKPKPTLHPGEHDSFEFKTSIAGGALYEPYWVVENGGGDTVHTFFQVPTVGANEISCADNKFTEPSKYIAASCTQDKKPGGPWHPVITMVWTDR